MIVSPISSRSSGAARGTLSLLSMFGAIYSPWTGSRRGETTLKTLTELYEMEDYMLRDIGLTRLDVIRMLEGLKR